MQTIVSLVMTELEGLKKCSRVGPNASAALSWVIGGAPGASGASGATGASGAVRLATSRGSLLASRAFTAESDQPRATNDDRVLATALNLHANLASETGKRNSRIFILFCNMKVM